MLRDVCLQVLCAAVVVPVVVARPPVRSALRPGDRLPLSPLGATLPVVVVVVVA